MDCFQSHVQTVQQNAFAGPVGGPFSDEEAENRPAPTAVTGIKEETEDSDETQSDIEMGSPPMGPEHTYSTASKMGEDHCL